MSKLNVNCSDYLLGRRNVKAHHSSRVPQSIEHEGICQNLQRRRKKSADDMADKSVGEDVVWFADYHFPPPLPSSTSSSRKTIKKNPFKTLKGADLLGERELTRRFVSPSDLAARVSHVTHHVNHRADSCGQRTQTCARTEDGLLWRQARSLGVRRRRPEARRSVLSHGGCPKR